MDENIQVQARAVVHEFRNVDIRKAKVHQNSSLAIFLDSLLEQELLVPAKRRRQGKRGTRSARNHMLRKALWFARSSQCKANKGSNET